MRSCKLKKKKITSEIHYFKPFLINIETVVSLETLPAGIYLINVTTTKANITRKVMKM